METTRMESYTYSILVAEDEELLLSAISLKLKNKKIGVISCTSGRQAIDYMDCSNMKPDAIWLDYRLGDMDGIEIVQKIQSNKKWSVIPIFIVSNSATEENVTRMMALGVQKYIIKAEHRLEDIIDDIIQYIEGTKIKGG